MDFDRAKVEEGVKLILQGEQPPSSLHAERLQITMDDRPSAEVQGSQLCHLLANGYRRAQALATVIDDDPDDLLIQQLDLLEGVADSCAAWHVTLYAGEMVDDRIEIGDYRIAKLSDYEHQSLRSTFGTPLLDTPGSVDKNSVERWYEARINQPGPIVVASRQTVSNRDPAASYHVFFDRLHLISADHTLLVLIANYLLGTARVTGGSLGFDTGPGEGTSWSMKGTFGVDTLAVATDEDIRLLKACLDSFEEVPAWKMLVNEEVHLRTPVARLVILRALLDLFLGHKPNATHVSQACEGKPKPRKRDVQASLLCDALERYGRLPDVVDPQDRLAVLLDTRNAWVHRSGSTPLSKLWATHEDLPFLRQAVQGLMTIPGSRLLAAESDLFDLT